MRLDILPSLETGLYPAQSPHQHDTEQYFGPAIFRDLSTDEIAQLAQLEIFFVMFTNRCGSTYLTELMHQVGFGIPPKAEIFNSDLLIAACRQHGIESFTQYFLQAVLGWQAQGQVGFKIGAQQLFWLTRTGLLAHFKSVRIVNAVRADKVAQAVSLFIARETGQWHSAMAKTGETAKIAYSRDDILQCLQSIHQGQALISYYAQVHNVCLLETSYENTLENPDREITRIAEFLGAHHLAGSPVEPSAISISKQGNEDNRRLCARFKEDFYPQTGSSD
jgi:trehalose 2-sulfotransferase